MILNGGNLSYDYTLLGIDIVLMLEKYQAVKAMSLSFAERWCNSQPTDAHCGPYKCNCSVGAAIGRPQIANLSSLTE